MTTYIDDVCLRYRVPYETRDEVAIPADDQRQRQKPLWIKVARGVTVHWDGQSLQIKASVPKYLGGSFVNYPLVPAVPADFADLAARISTVVGIEVPDVTTMPVTSIAYTVDVRVQDPRRVCRGARGFHRSRDRGATSWPDQDEVCREVANGVVWGPKDKKGTEVSMYDKGRELGDPAAHGILRVTATPKGLDAIRGCVTGIRKGYVPTLATMLRQDVADYVMSREIIRLRLPEALDGLPLTDLDVAARAWTLLFDMYKPERAETLWSQLGAWRAGLTEAQATKKTGRSPASVHRDRVALSALHLAPSDDPAATEESASELRHMFAPYLVARTAPPVGEDGYAPNPWTAVGLSRAFNIEEAAE